MNNFSICFLQIAYCNENSAHLMCVGAEHASPLPLLFSFLKFSARVVIPHDTTAGLEREDCVSPRSPEVDDRMGENSVHSGKRKICRYIFGFSTV